MVAVQSYPETAASVVSRRTNERLAGVIPLEPWNFRDGRGRKFDMFKQSLTRAVKLLNIDYVFTQRTVDSFETFQAWYTLSRKLATRAHSQSVREGYDDYVLNFQIDISVLYHLLAKATDIITDNEDWKEDAEAVNAMIAGSVADIPDEKKRLFSLMNDCRPLRLCGLPALTNLIGRGRPCSGERIVASFFGVLEP